MTALADRVKESTTTTGTGSLTLSGAVAQFESFNTAFGTAAPFYYVITDANGTDWEVGTGELSNATTLVRTTVHQSSNADAKINLSAGTHTVFCSAPAVFLAGLASKSGKLSQFAATTSAELAGVISDETGSGALVFATSPTLTTPNIGVATATSVNGTTIPSSKTLVVTTDKLSALAATTSAELAGVISDETGTGSLVFASSPSLTTPDIGAATATSVNGTTIPSSKTLVVTTDKLSALAATTSAELAGVISDETGSGSLVFATSPSLTTPNIGTPSAGTLTNCTGLPVGGVSGLGTGVGTALAVNTGSAGAFVVNGGALGTPSSGTLTNATGLPVSTGVSGLGTGVATALAVNTGSSGAVVVNGGALGTPSSGTVTNLTGTASININGTVGATTANTGAFTTLSATGVATFSAGTAAAPAITTSGDTNNGIYFPAADVTAITTAGSERMRVESGGVVDIGTSGVTTYSARALNVAAATSSLGSTNQSGNIFVYSTDAVAADIGGSIGFGGYYTGTTAFPWCGIAGKKENGTSGQTGAYLQFLTTTNGGNPTERLRIDSSGNVGIGTSSPNGSGSGYTTLHVNNATNGGQLHLTGGGSGAASTDGSLFTQANTELFINNQEAGPVNFYVNGSERMRITSDGDVLVGCTSAPSASVVGVRLGKSATQGYGMSSTSSTGSVEHWYYYNPNGLVGTITTSGSATAYNTSSDRRLKDNIAPAGKAQDILNSIEIVQHDWKAGGHTRFGVVAQDLNEVYPEAVAAGDNGDVVKKTWGVDYSKLVPLLVKSIQEQQQQIDALKAEIAALKGNA